MAKALPIALASKTVTLAVLVVLVVSTGQAHHTVVAVAAAIAYLVAGLGGQLLLMRHRTVKVPAGATALRG